MIQDRAILTMVDW